LDLKQLLNIFGAIRCKNISTIFNLSTSFSLGVTSVFKEDNF